MAESVDSLSLTGWIGCVVEGKLVPIFLYLVTFLEGICSLSELVCVEGLCSFWSSRVLNDNHSNLVSFPGRSDFL